MDNNTELREDLMEDLKLQLMVKEKVPSTKPPESIFKFKRRLERVLDEYLEKCFGITYYLDFDKRSSLKKDPSYSNMIDLVIQIDKKASKERSISYHIHSDGYGFLKEALEKGFPFSIEAQNLLGVHIKRSNLNKCLKHRIKVQAAAQVLWCIEKDKLPSIQSMHNKLLDKNGELFTFLELEELNLDMQTEKLNSESVKDWISEVFPKPKDLRKGRPSKEKSGTDISFDAIVPIAEIFSINGLAINYQALQFAITSLSKVLSLLGWSNESIKDSKIIESYRERLEFYPRRYIDDWIDESSSEK